MISTKIEKQLILSKPGIVQERSGMYTINIMVFTGH